MRTLDTSLNMTRDTSDMNSRKSPSNASPVPRFQSPQNRKAQLPNRN